MRITLFIGGLGSGGAEHVITELANYLSVNNEVTILTWASSAAHYVLNKQVNLLSCRNRNDQNRIVRIIESYRNLKKYVKQTSTDCYVVFLAPTVYLLLSLRRLISVPIIFSIRCYPKEEYGGLINGLLSGILLKKADGVVYQTEEQRQYMHMLSRIPSAIIPNAVNINQEYIKANEIIQNGSAKRIMAVGRLSKQKNYRMMIEVMTTVLKEYPEYQLDIYGEGPEGRRIQQLIIRNHMQENIHLRGVTKKIIEKLRTADVFLMTSDYEGISNALIEAMAVGVAVVATDCLGGGARLLIKDGENGLLVPKGDKAAFTNAVRKVLANRAFRMNLAQNAQKIREVYSSETIYKQWEQFIRSLVNSR